MPTSLESGPRPAPAAGLLPARTPGHLEYKQHDGNREELTQNPGGSRLGVAKWPLSKEERHQDDQMGWSGRRGLDSISYQFLMSSTFLPSVLSILLPPFCFPDLGVVFPLPNRSSSIFVFLAFLPFQMDSLVGLICFPCLAGPSQP